MRSSDYQQFLHMSKEPIVMSQSYQPAHRTMVKKPAEKGKIRAEGYGFFRYDGLSFVGFSPVITLAGLVIWEFGLRAACGSCAHYVQSHRKKSALNI